MVYSTILQGLSVLFSIIFSIYIGYYINNKKIYITKRKLMLVSMTTAIHVYLFYIFDFTYHYNVINFILIGIIIFIVFFENKSEVPRIYLSIILIVVLSNIFICSILVNIMKVPIKSIYLNKNYKYLVDIITGAIACALIHIKYLYYKYHRPNKRFMEKNMLYIFLICAIGTLAINSHLIYYCNNAYDRKNIFIILLIFSVFQGGIILLFSHVNNMSQKKEKILYRKEREYENLKLHLELTEALILDVNKFRHDYNNMIHTMNGYICDNDIEGLKEYMNTEILEDYTYNNIPSLNKIKNSGLKGLLTAKISEMFRADIKVSIDILGEIESLNMDIVDFSRVLGVLLDNACEAAKDSFDKTVSIMITEGSEVNVTVMNSFAENINIMKIYDEGISSKGENRGLGLSNVREIIDIKYDNVIINTMIRDGMFIQDLYIS